MVFAAAVWGEHWRGQLIFCHSDNTAVVAQLNSLHACDPLACNMLCCPFPSLHSPYMKILLRGIRRIQAQPTSARIRLPITASLMRRIKAQLSLPPTSFLKVLIWAACSVGVGFLWVSSGWRVPRPGWCPIRSQQTPVTGGHCA